MSFSDWWQCDVVMFSDFLFNIMQMSSHFRWLPQGPRLTIWDQCHQVLQISLYYLSLLTCMDVISDSWKTLSEIVTILSEFLQCVDYSWTFSYVLVPVVIYIQTFPSRMLKLQYRLLEVATDLIFLLWCASKWNNLSKKCRDSCWLDGSRWNQACSWL